MVDMYRQATGQTIDGVLAIDVPGLAELLRVVGPVPVAGVDEPVTADNAARILLHDLYEGLLPHDNQADRRELLSDVAGAVIDRLSTGARDLVGLGTALSRASGGGHLRMSSTVAAEEEAFERTGIGGGPAVMDADRTFHLAVETRAATKLDYYVKPTVRQDVDLDKSGTAVVRTTVVVDNQAPVGAPPSYALGPDDITTQQPGDYVGWILLWGPAAAEQASSTNESGLTLSQFVATVGPGRQREVTFTTTIRHAVRKGRLALRLVPQSRLEPMALDVHLHAPGWRVKGAPDWKGPWDKVERLSWGVDR